MFTSKWVRFEASKVEEAVVLVSINPVQMGEIFRKSTLLTNLNLYSVLCLTVNWSEGRK